MGRVIHPLAEAGPRIFVRYERGEGYQVVLAQAASHLSGYEAIIPTASQALDRINEYLRAGFPLADEHMTRQLDLQLRVLEALRLLATKVEIETAVRGLTETDDHSSLTNAETAHLQINRLQKGVS